MKFDKVELRAIRAVVKRAILLHRPTLVRAYPQPTLKLLYGILEKLKKEGIE